MIIALDGRPLISRTIGGAEQYARQVVREWAVMDLPHTFVICLDRGQSDRATHDFSLLESLPAERFRRLDVQSFQTPIWLAAPTRFISSLARSLVRAKIDVFYSFTPSVPPPSVCPVIPTVHDLAFELDPVVRHRPGSRDLRRHVSQSAKWASRIVAVSLQTKTDIEAIYHIATDKVDIVYNGLNPAYVPETDRELRGNLRQRHGINRPYVIAVGSDIPRRNYARMLRAMQIAWQTLPRYRLMLVGHNAWVSTPLYDLAREAQVLDRLYLVHSPTDRELAQLYRDAAITCCASSFEGFGLSVLESLACGTPVACSDMRSLREVADDAALYFPHDDAAAMGESIVGLIEDAEYRRQLRYRGLARAKLFTWRTAAELLIKTLERAHAEDS